MATSATHDDRGVRYDSAIYPHDMACIRKACGPRPQSCNCGGDAVAGGGAAPSGLNHAPPEASPSGSQPQDADQ